MVKKIKYGKILVVVFLTALIWVWADLAKTEKFPVSSVTVTVARSTNPALWVSFSDGESSISIQDIILKGPASRVSDVRRRLDAGSLSLEFFFDAEARAMTEPGRNLLNVLNFLKQSDQIRQLGLTVESCSPKTVDVYVVKLVKKSLTVECLDENRVPLKAETIEPAKVDMFVPADWQGEKLLARVSLTEREIDQARATPVPKTPYIELAPGWIRRAPQTVKITTPPGEDRRSDYTITASTLGIALSPTLQGKYRVEVSNLSEVISAIAIRATPEAKRAYELQPVPSVTLYVLDGDEKTSAEQRRKVVYNFPEEYLRDNQIALRGQGVEARFKLIPLPATEIQPGPGR